LHDVDQNERIIGVPASTSDLVSTVSPFEFSTTTDGTCANATEETIRNMATRIFFIPINWLYFATT
jgi:hypothetical protein